MLEEIRTKIAREISAGLAFQELRALHEIDRWFTFPAFEKSARHLANAWKAAGCSSAKVERFPADGRTLAGSWKMPLAWDAREAVLSVEYPDELRGTVIARYSERPTSLMMWSAPTPKKGVTAELVYLPDAGVESSYRKTDVRGRIVFTSARGAFAKGLAAKHGAIGIVSDFVTAHFEKPDATFWTNAWSDDPNGWGLTTQDSRLFGFAITPRQGEWLRGILAGHGRVVLKAIVDTKIYKGTLPAVTAVIPGASRREEVLAIGHAFEQGAIDNASGVAVMLEAARVLAKLIREGALPRPRRTIRFLAVSECYTTFAYSERFRERMQGTVAAACFDSVGERQDVCRTMLAVHRPPDSNASFVTAVAERLADVTFAPWRPYFRWVARPYATTDNVISDPLIGPPAILVGQHPGFIFWHSDADTLDKVDVEALGKAAEYAAVYLYIIASAGAVDALYFAGLAAARAKAELYRGAALALEACRDGKSDAETARKRVLYAAETGLREVESVKTLLLLREFRSIAKELAKISGSLVDEGRRCADDLEHLLSQCGRAHGAAPSAERDKLLRAAASFVPKRKYIGALAFDLVPIAKREGFSDPRWEAAVTAALFWCDGRRTLAEVLELAGSELGADLSHLVGIFRFMAKKGLIEMRKA